VPGARPDFFQQQLLPSAISYWDKLSDILEEHSEGVSSWRPDYNETTLLLHSIRNGSGRSLRLWVRFKTEPLSNSQSRLLIHTTCQFLYGSREITRHVWIGWDVSRSPSGSICTFIYGSGFCCMKIEPYQNWVLNIHGSLLHILQFAISMILECMFFLLHVVFLAIKALNCSVMSSGVCTMPCWPNSQDQKLLTLSWRSFSWWGNVYVIHCFAWKCRHCFIYQ